MNEINPLVSIVVRTKDRPQLLKRSLQSIAVQIYRPIEVVIVNDGGCDLDLVELKDILGDVALKYIGLENNTGRAFAGNVGIENAAGEYIGFLDDDDELYPDHTRILVDFLKNREVKVVYTDSLMVYREYDSQTDHVKTERSELVFSEDYDYDKLVFENYIPLMCLLFDREVLLNSGGFDISFDLYEDWELLIRIGNQCSFYHINKTTANYNQWNTDLQISQKNTDMYFLKQSYLKVINKHIDKITPYRVHNFVSGFVNTKHELTAQREVCKDFENKLNEREQTIAALESSLNEGEQTIAALESSLNEREQTITTLGAGLAEREAYIQMIHSGLGPQLLTKYFTMRDRLLPEGTKRRLFAKLFLKTVKSPKTVLKDINKSNLRKFYYYLNNADPLTLEKKVRQKLSDESDYRAPLVTKKQNIPLRTAGIDYFSYLFDMNTIKGDDYVPLSSPALPNTNIKLIAFYLPQFHPIPENDEWWGKGFTEWSNVARAVPQFIGHYQPRLPGELGFYDLRIPEVQERQIELAKQYGIHGFCFHFYWFNGKTLLEKPIKQFSESYNFPFCINWANENWTRRWDGKSSHILIAQKHSPEDDISFIKHVSQYFKKEHYIKIKSKPLLIIYRPSLFPNPKATAQRWREWCLKNGIGEIYLALTHSFEHIEPKSLGFDAAIEFPPNTFPLKDISGQFNIVNPDYKGVILDYEAAVTYNAHINPPAYKKFKGICPSWDNEARRSGRGTVLVNSTPNSYEKWLSMLCDYTNRNFDPEERLIFINAWNEWAEGAYLEPDRRYGYAYLHATANALSPLPKGSTLPGRWKIMFVSHDACKGGAQNVLLNIIFWVKRHTFADIKILCLDGGEFLSRFRELGATLDLSEMRSKRITEAELTRQLMKFCDGAPDLMYCNSVVSGREYELLRSLDTPILMHVHELEMSIRRYAAAWIHDSLKYSSHIIACSYAVRKNLVEHHNCPEEKITTVYASILPDRSISVTAGKEKRALRRNLKLKEDKFLIVGCGIGMVFRKGADLFIEVARSLRNRGLDNFHCYWIGDFDMKSSDSRYGVWADYITALKKEGLDNDVTFIGLREKPRDYMRAGDVFLLPSREDPFPLVALEAAECGLPVICFAEAGGMPDFVGDDAGFVVHYEDAEALAEKVVVLMGNEDLRRQLGARAREKVLSGFTVEHTTPHIFSVCRKVAQKKPAVSVIIPNYNHARYLQKRLDSVFNQTFKDFEVILLDDASTDNSMEILNKYAGHADVRILRNDKNSGSPFRQWIKGIDLATAEIIWIAESDDICEPRFLETLLHAFQDPEVKLAYVNSHVIDENDSVTGDYENGEYLTSLSQTKWKESYQVSATEEINDGLGVKDTILNVSAVLFRRVKFDEELRKTLENMSIAGDWFFIVNAIKYGKVHYNAGKLNYHRRHAESVIAKAVSVKKMEDFFREFCIVQQFVFDNYKLDDNFCEKWESYLRKQWNDFYPNRPFEELQAYYPFDAMKEKILRKAKDPAAERACKEGSIVCKGDYRRHGASNEELLREVEDSLTTVHALSAVAIKRLLENVGDEFYFWLLTEGHAQVANQALINLLPAMPDEQIQTNWTGSSGYETLRQAFLAFSLFKKIINKHHKDIRSCDRILDFGCGWGRLIRFFLKDIEPEGLWGIDCFEEAITICKNSNLRCNFESIDVMPPTHLPDDFFDAIYLYSVFSHLSEEAHMAWLLEFKRILKPGGVVIATTRPRHFIIECDVMRKDKNIKAFQHGAVASFQNINESLSDYDNGRFCHSPTGGGGVLSTSFYGETAIPKKYVIERWTKHFSFVDFIYDDDHKSFDQNVIIAKK